MKIELIQPFINAADAVLAHTLATPPNITAVLMDEQPYLRKGVAALVQVKGEIEGRMILDIEPETARRIALHIAAGEEQSTQAWRDTVCELANQIIGNAITTLNDTGFRFRVTPPSVHTSDRGLEGSADTEALVMRFDTRSGPVFLNIAMRYTAPFI